MVLRSMLYAVAAGTVLSWTVPALAQRTVTVVREIDTDRYDPHKSTARSNAEVMYMVGDTLVNLDYDMKTLKPGLATSWSVSPTMYMTSALERRTASPTLSSFALTSPSAQARR
jgi:ABC-type transport system substrate-binding protein